MLTNEIEEGQRQICFYFVFMSLNHQNRIPQNQIPHRYILHTTHPAAQT